MEVHTQYLRRRFVAPWLSVAATVNLLILAGVLILPLYIAYASRSAWGAAAQGPGEPRFSHVCACCSATSPSHAPALASLLDQGIVAV